MSKKVLLIAGALLAAGSVAAVSSPHFRGVQLRLAQMLDEFGDGDTGSRSARSGKRHRQMDADDIDDAGREAFGKGRRARSAERRLDREAEPAEEGGKRRLTSERRPGRDDRRFARLDRDGDGFIEAKEFEIWAAESAARASQRFLERFDTDGDGKVSRDEFRQSAKDRFANRDADGDDRLTEVELTPTKPGRGIVQ